MFSGRGGRSKDLPTIARQLGKYDKYTWERQIQVRTHNMFGGNALDTWERQIQVHTHNMFGGNGLGTDMFQQKQPQARDNEP